MKSKNLIIPLNISPDGFAFDPARGESYILNPSACLIMQQLQQGKSRSEIVDVIAAKFGVPYSTVEQDVHHFIAQLKLLGILGADI